MDTTELVIWAAMSGAILLLIIVAAADVVRLGNAPAWRGLGFVLLTGATAVLMSGLPEYLLHITDPRDFLPAKVAMGPLSSVLALTYLGLWLGYQDRVLQWMVVGGAMIALVCAVGMIVVTVLSQSVSPQLLLSISGAVNLLTIAMAGTAAVRATMLGDSLARWMTVSCGLFAIMVIGLYAKGLRLEAGHWLWIVTALCTVAVFLVTTALTLLRNQQQRRLQRLARGKNSLDEITGLPMGFVLAGRLDDALWRSTRADLDCAVVAVWVKNLHELSDKAGHQIEHEISVRLTANLRRAVGFRNTVGLMQARCFLVVISAVKDRQQVEKIVEKLIIKINRPMRVGELVGAPYTFTADAGYSLLHVPQGEHTEPMKIMDKAQSLAQQACDLPGRLLQQEHHAG